MNTRKRSPILSLALLGAGLLVFTGCGGSAANGGGGGRSGRTVDEPTGPRSDATVNRLPDATRAFMENGLRQFSAQEPGWERTRAEWLSMGDRESAFLVSLMWGALLKAQKLAAGELVERARFELAKIGGPSVPLLTGILSGGTAWSFYDDISEETKVVPIDDTSRREAAEILTLIGPEAVDGLVRVLDVAETKSGRKFALSSLGNMGDRGGDGATQAILRHVDDPDWIVRVEAVHALRTHGDATTAAALMRALRDSETLVREKAADALAARVETSALGALAAARDAARSAGRLGEARRHARAIATIEARSRR